jgi:hypothetical protein
MRVHTCEALELGRCVYIFAVFLSLAYQQQMRRPLA